MRPAVSLLAALVAVLVLSFGSPAAAEARGGGKAGMNRAERAVVGKINAQRRAHGLRRLRRSRGLGRAANVHSGAMLRGDFFGHDSANGTSFGTRVRRFARFGTLGETLAHLPRCGRPEAGRVVQMWMQSPPHRAVLLSPSFRYVGIGARRGSLGGGRTCVVTADFGA